MSNARRWDAIIFDFDGVIANSEPVYFETITKLMRSYGHDVSWDDYCRYCRGVGDDNIPAAVTKMNPAARDWRDLAERYATLQQEAARRLAEFPPIAPGTIALVRSLTGYPIGLVSAAMRVDIDPLLRKTEILDSFQTTVFAEDVEHTKPAPDPYLLAAKTLRALRPLVFEDSETGMASARAAGFEVVQVTEPEHLPDLVRQQLGAEAFVS